mgnify:CR=1 FL=1
MSTDTQTLDIPKVSAYLEKHLEGFEGPLEVSKFQAGQSNPTFLLKTPSRNYVLRRKPPGVLLKSAHAVDREFRVQKALQDTDVPVSKMHLLCEDDDVIGSAFYIMDHIDGRNFMDPRMPEMDKAGRAGVIDEMNRVLAALHDVDIDAVGLSDYGPPGNYYERQVARWTKQYRASETEDLPAMNQLIEKLTASIPEDDGQRTLVEFPPDIAQGEWRLSHRQYDVRKRRHQLLGHSGLGTVDHWPSLRRPCRRNHAMADARGHRRARLWRRGPRSAWRADRC